MPLIKLLLQGNAKTAGKAVGLAKKLARQSFEAGRISQILNAKEAIIRIENLLRMGASRVTIKGKEPNAASEVYGNATLIRYSYGSGMVIGSTLTLEFGERYNQDTKYILRGLIPYQVSGGTVLLVENSAPWQTTSNQKLLNENGISFVKKTINQAESETLGSYQKIIISSDQTTAFYIEYMNQKTRFDDYVDAGGVLEWHATGYGWNSGKTADLVLPGGVTINTDQLYYNYNYNVAKSDPIMSGVPSEIYGTYASHTYLEYPTDLVGVDVLAVEALDK